MNTTALFLANIGLAKRYAQKHTPPQYHEQFSEDIVQVCYVGLWKACLTWDAGKGALSTHAYSKMRGEMSDYYLHYGILTRQGITAKRGQPRKPVPVPVHVSFEER